MRRLVTHDGTRAFAGMRVFRRGTWGAHRAAPPGAQLIVFAYQGTTGAQDDNAFGEIHPGRSLTFVRMRLPGRGPIGVGAALWGGQGGRYGRPVGLRTRRQLLPDHVRRDGP